MPVGGLSLGGVDFTVEANTRGMQNALRTMQRFEATVNRTARSQSEGARRAAAALGKQESAMKRAFQQAAALQRQMRLSGASKEEIAKVTKALQSLNHAMSKGELNSVQFARAQDAFAAKMNRSKRSLDDLKKGATGATNRTERLKKVFRELESASVLAIGPLSGLGARMRAFGAILGRESIRLAVVIGLVTALGVALGTLAAAAVRAGVEWERAMARFQLGSESLKDARGRMGFVIQLSQTLGITINETARAFSRMTAAAAGTTLEGQMLQNVFTGIAKAGAALRLNAIEMEGIFRAVEQIMSKGSVQAEELRGQLGERLPGAFNIAAQAMGVTTQRLNEMLKAGEVTAEEFLPKFAAELERIAEKGNLIGGLTQSWNRFLNSIKLLATEFNEMLGLTNLLTAFFNEMRATVDLVRMSFLTYGVVVKALGEALFQLSQGDSVTFLQNLNKAIVIAVGQLAEFQRTIENMPASVGSMSDAVEEAHRQLMRMSARIRAMKQGGEAARIFDEITAPVQDFRDALIEAGTSVSEADALTAAFAKRLEEINSLERQLVNTSQMASDAIVNGLEDAIFSGDKFSDVLKNIGLELIKIAFRSAIFGPLTEGLTGMFSGSGFSLPKLGKAAGGPVNRGTSYMVGERGPEIFTPRVSGNITSNGQMNGGGGGGGQVFNLTINAPGADEGTIARIRQMITTEMAPQIIKAATVNTFRQSRRPRIA